MPKVTVVTPTIRPEGLKIIQECLSKQTFQDFEWLVEIGIPNKGHDFNKAMNRMLRRAKGELIVSYQDWTKIPDDGLEKFWEAYKKDPRFYTAPLGKVKNKDFTGAPKFDWRTHTTDADWTRWETDWACAPKKALIEIGGWDEYLDEYWSFDNVNVGLRADMAGYKFGCLPDNKAVAFDHDFDEKHPFRDRYNPAHHNERMDEIRQGLKIEFTR